MALLDTKQWVFVSTGCNNDVIISILTFVKELSTSKSRFSTMKDPSTKVALLSLTQLEVKCDVHSSSAVKAEMSVKNCGVTDCRPGKTSRRCGYGVCVCVCVCVCVKLCIYSFLMFLFVSGIYNNRLFHIKHQKFY